MDESIPEAEQTGPLLSEPGASDPEPTVLCVDDESNVLRALRRLLRREPYRLLFADGGAQALTLLEDTPVQLVISDQRMPGMTGTDFLREVKLRYPTTIRVMLSGYAEVSAIVASINEGEIYRFLAKPWNDEQLKTSIRQCLDHHDLLASNKRLLRQVKHQNEELRVLNASLEELVEERTFSLRLSQEVLARIPLPVVGVSAEGMVVMLNESVGETFPSTGPIWLGAEARDVLSPQVYEGVRLCLEDGKRQEIEPPLIDARATLRVEPLLDRGAVRGCLLILMEKAYA